MSGIGAPRLNLELKARDRDPVRSLEVCRQLGAADEGTLTQRDTYFEAPQGRYNWLNRTLFVGVGRRDPQGSLFRYWKVV